MFDWCSDIAESITEIPKLIAEKIERIFIPDTTEIQESIDDLKNRFQTAFGIGAVDLSEVMGTETKIVNQHGTIKYGNKSYTGVVFDVKYIVKAVTTFRPYIRGFIVIMMMIYNINQFLNFIGLGKIDLGGGKSTDIQEVK